MSGHQLAHTWDEARTVSFDGAQPVAVQRVPLEKASGRTLAEDVAAAQDLPHYASSAMDGWAVAGSAPWILAEPGERLTAHQASPVVTGGVLPPGTKAVLRKESGRITEDEDGYPVLVHSENAKPGEPRNGQHIRPAAEEAAAGDVLIAAGTTLNPAHVALAALAGRDELTVVGRPQVRLVFTGGEVVTSGLPAPGQVRDTFGPQLGTVVGLLGGEVTGADRVGDSLADWMEALEAPGHESADVVITTGGTGLSDADHLREAIDKLGGRLLVDGVAMRPGHPVVLAELPGSRFHIGLPGNPLAAMMAILTIGGPLLAKLASLPAPATAEVPCGAVLEADPGRTRLVPYRLVYGLASPAKHAGPGMLRGLAGADGVMVVPPHGVQLGEPVPAMELPWKPGAFKPPPPVPRTAGRSRR